jgi:hypothetical protein
MIHSHSEPCLSGDDTFSVPEAVEKIRQASVQFLHVNALDALSVAVA